MSKEKTVFAVSVKTKHFLADFFQWFKNLIGMNLSAYEEMIEDSIEEAIYKTPIKAGCPEGGIVLDPFFGAGTTGLVALKQNKKFIGIELNKEYIRIANKRLKPFLE